MSKTIMIADDIYSALSKIKQPKESFTKLFSRLIGLSQKQKGSLLECAGMWGHLSEQEIHKRKKLIRQGRESWRELKW